MRRFEIARRVKNAGKVKILALTMVAALMLSACSGASQSSNEIANVALPEPETALPRQILGDTSSVEDAEVTLYYPAADGVSLTAVTRSIQIGRNENLLRRVLETLLEGESGSSLSGGSVEADLIGLEHGSGVVTVNLSIDAGVNRSDQDYLQMCASIANTLLALDGVQAVNLLTGGRSEPVCSLPTGAFTDMTENIPAAYAQLQAEQQRFGDADTGGIVRSAVLYFPAQGGRYLLAETRTLEIKNDDYASAVIAALSDGPIKRKCCFAAIPGNLELLASEPECILTERGERVLELNFSATLHNYLAFAGVEPWQLYASVVLSLSSFVPEIDAVRIRVDGEYVFNSDFRERPLSFEEGLMRRDDFAECIGGSARLYFAGESGMLIGAECPMSQSAAESAMGLLCELFSFNSASIPELHSVLPEGIAQEDVLGVTVENRVAAVNLSGNFYSRCQSLNVQQERALIYAMVNTLASLPQIGAVSFLIEGEQADSLAQSIYLKTALMPDPGLVQNLTAEEQSLSE